MTLLLDTQVFLWWNNRDPSLNATAQAAIEDPANDVYASAASVWEIAIERRRGKWRFAGSAAMAIAANGFLELPILPLEPEQAADLPWAHKATTKINRIA